MVITSRLPLVDASESHAEAAIDFGSISKNPADQADRVVAVSSGYDFGVLSGHRHFLFGTFLLEHSGLE